MAKAEKVSFTVIILVLYIFLNNVLTFAAIPYSSYVYDFDQEKVKVPAPYIYERIIDFKEMGIGGLSAPEDMYISDDGNIYLLDSGNKRIVVIDKNFNLVKIIDGFINNGKEDGFNGPEGIFVTEDNHIYVADTQNERIIHLDSEGQFIREIGPPRSDVEGVIPQSYIYRPKRIGVDPVGRIYVVVKNRYEGLVSFDSAGEFMGFMGAPKVTPSISEIIWRAISTKAQKERRIRFIPTLFTSIDVDPKGFLYTTIASSDRDDLIRRLNLAGDDVLRREGFIAPKGDIVDTSDDSVVPTTFIDIKGYQYGTYSALDGINGKIFTYDVDGNLLYVFGTKGTQRGTFNNPVALEIYNNHIFVLDKGLNQLIVFKPTAFATYILSALEYYNLGLFEESTEMWQQVLKLNNHYELAYRWIANALVRENRFKEAMEYYRLANYREGYSEAFKYFRQEYVKENFIYVFIALVILLVIAFLYLHKKDNKKERMKGYKYVAAGKIKGSDFPSIVKRNLHALRYALYVIFHPFDGFWDIKHEQRGTATAATIILFFVSVTYIIVRQYTGFILNTNKLTELNIYMEFASIIVPFLLWCIVNWSITTLMDGKGKFKEIYTTTAYALTPIILINLPLTLVSNMITLEEASFYYLFKIIALLWSALLVFFGMQTIHDYTMGKNTLATIFTIVGIGIVIFIALLFFSVISKLYNFIFGIYTEIMFRL